VFAAHSTASSGAENSGSTTSAGRGGGEDPTQCHDAAIHRFEWQSATDGLGLSVFHLPLGFVHVWWFGWIAFNLYFVKRWLAHQYDGIFSQKDYTKKLETVKDEGMLAGQVVPTVQSAARCGTGMTARHNSPANGRAKPQSQQSQHFCFGLNSLQKRRERAISSLRELETCQQIQAHLSRVAAARTALGGRSSLLPVSTTSGGGGGGSSSDSGRGGGGGGGGGSSSSSSSGGGSTAMPKSLVFPNIRVKASSRGHFKQDGRVSVSKESSVRHGTFLPYGNLRSRTQ
jgi:hypothetical protein